MAKRLEGRVGCFGKVNEKLSEMALARFPEAADTPFSDPHGQQTQIETPQRGQSPVPQLRSAARRAFPSRCSR